MPGLIDPRSSLHLTAKAARARLHGLPEVDPRLAFGPQHAAITALIERLAALSPEEDAAVEAAWFELRGPARFAARSAASQVASTAGRLDAQLTARQRAWSASTLSCRDAAGDAASALAVRDLVGQGLSRQSYDELVAPWARVIGPAHPDDEAR